MSQALAIAILAGIVSVALGLAPVLGSFILLLASYFVHLPMILAGLAMGTTATVIAAITAIVLSGLIGGPLLALIYIFAFAMPSFLVVRQALLSRQDPGGLVWYPPGFVLAQLAVFAAFVLALAFMALSGQPDGLIGVVIEPLVRQMFEQVSTAANQPLPEGEVLRSVASFVPGAAACSWLVMVVVNSVVAQAIAVRKGWNRRPSARLAELELPRWLWPLLGAAVLMALIGSTEIGTFALSAAIVLIAPFGFLGLAVIHRFADQLPQRGLGLAAIYAAMFVGVMVFGLWFLMAVVALGIVEDWAHLRRYM